MTDTKTAAVTTEAEPFFRAVLNTALAASTDDTLPAICAVHLHSAGKGILLAEATDRYIAAREDIPAEGGPLDVLISARALTDTVKTLAKALKAANGRVHQADPPQVRLEAGEHLVQVTLTRYLGPDITLPLAVRDGDFPKTARFFDQPAVPGDGAGQAIGARLLALLAKVDNGRPAQERFIRLQFHEPVEVPVELPGHVSSTRTECKPVLAWVNDSTWRAVIKPVIRKDGEDNRPGPEQAPSPAHEHDDQPDTRPASAKYKMTLQRTGREHRVPPVPVGVTEPTVDELEAMLKDAATDSGGPSFPTSCIHGCEVEPDGKCPHGHPTWLVRFALI